MGRARERARGMWRMKNALTSRAPWDPSCGRFVGARSLVFHRALMCRGRVSGLLQNSRAGVCFAKLVYVPFMCQEPGIQSGADTIFFLMQFIIYLRTLHGVERGQQVSLEGLEVTWFPSCPTAFIFPGLPAHQSGLLNLSLSEMDSIDIFILWLRKLRPGESN